MLGDEAFDCIPTRRVGTRNNQLKLQPVLPNAGGPGILKKEPG
jgi:hypothetical protein